MTAPTFGERFVCRLCRGKGTAAGPRRGTSSRRNGNPRERIACPDCTGGLVDAATLRAQLVALAEKILADPRSGPWERASAKAYIARPYVPEPVG